MRIMEKVIEIDSLEILLYEDFEKKIHLLCELPVLPDSKYMCQSMNY